MSKAAEARVAASAIATAAAADASAAIAGAIFMLANTYDDMSIQFLTRLLDIVRAATGATGACIAERLPMGNSDPAHIRYIATGSADTVMLSKVLDAGQGVTWRAWEGGSVEALGSTDDGKLSEVIVPSRPVYIRSLIQDPSAVFFALPRRGSFLAVPADYPCVIHPGAGEENGITTDDANIDNDDASDGFTDVPSTASRPLQINRHLALVLDKLSLPYAQDVPFTAMEIAAVTQVAAALAAAFERTELTKYAAHVAADSALSIASALPERAAEVAMIDEGASPLYYYCCNAHLAPTFCVRHSFRCTALVEAAAAVSEESPDDIHEYSQAKFEAVAVQRLLLTPPWCTIVDALAMCRIPPSMETVDVIAATLCFFGVPLKTLVDPTGLFPNKPAWEVVRAHLQRLAELLAACDIDAAPSMPLEARRDAARRMLEASSVVSIGALPRLLARFVGATLRARKATAAILVREQLERAEAATVSADAAVAAAKAAAIAAAAEGEDADAVAAAAETEAADSEADAASAEDAEQQ